ncbi:MAG: pantoate kinase [Candidatus Thermoplasmatota archaeon]
MLKAAGFAPGHISGFFSPFYVKEDMLRTGSKGAGVSLNIGSISEVSICNSKKQVFEIFLNGKRCNFTVVRSALNYLLGDSKVRVRVNIKFGLPLSQGFGMSAAASLSTCFALSKVTDFSHSDAIHAAHFAEVASGTGLGDVVGSSFGGFEIRKKPGLPPWGIIEHIPGVYDLVLCTVDKPVNTKNVLNDSSLHDRICEVGDWCTEKLLDNPCVEKFFSLSKHFAVETDLARGKILKAIESAEEFGTASMCMLGNSVFAVGKTENLCKVLSSYGRVFVSRVDVCGARVLEVIKK